jgi:hypothetical protein
MIVTVLGTSHMFLLLWLVGFLAGMLWGARDHTARKWVYSIVWLALFCTVSATIAGGSVGLALIGFGILIGRKRGTVYSAEMTTKIAGVGLGALGGSPVIIILVLMVHKGVLPDVGSRAFYLLVLGFYSVVSGLLLLVRPSVVAMLSALLATSASGLYYILEYDFPSAGVAYLLLIPLMGLNGFRCRGDRSSRKLGQLFGALGTTHHPFNQDLVRARIAIYHLDKHPSEYVEPSLILAEYVGGKWAACGVVRRDGGYPRHRFYIYHVETCKIREISPDDAEFSMAQGILDRAISLRGC